MRALILLSTSVVSLCIGQTNFGAAEENANPSSDVNTRIFTGPASPLFLSNAILLLGSPTLKHVAGNQALDSGLVGIGLGALGATVLAPAGQLFPAIQHLFIGPRCPWGPIYGSGCLSQTN